MFRKGELPMKKLMILAIISLFSLSAAAASACDGMKDHDRGTDTQAKNETGKAGGKSDKADTKIKPGGTKSRTDEGASKS
jgi:hypothetical protein